jgi:type I restriction enzyme S subunit
VDEYLFDDDLLLIAEDGANLVLRNLPLAIIARGKFWVNNHAHILKPKRGNLEYLAALMECINYQPWMSGAAQPKLTLDRLMSITIALPPAEEQAQIVQVQSEENGPLRAAIKQANREITLLREYRTRLIADVVTGKLDVRDAAAGLPEEGIEEASDEEEDVEGLEAREDDLDLNDDADE